MSNTLLDFADYRRSRGRKVTPELLEVGKRIEERKEAARRYANRDFWCRMGLHSRRQHWAGGGYPATCVKCWRERL